MMSFDSKGLLGCQKMRTHATMVFTWSERQHGEWNQKKAMQTFELKQDIGNN